jgi:16S rRNA (guanine527-N7)-methyltransferase
VTPEKFMKFAGVSRETLVNFVSYHTIMLKWQAKINLVSASTLDEIWDRHFADSAQYFVLLSVDDKVVVDLGSGAGLPAIPLALMARASGRTTIFHVVESDGRKAAFLVEAARVVDLLNVNLRIHAQRAEKFAAGAIAGTVDLVTARALGRLAQLLGYAHPLLAPTGRCIFLKGERAQEEIAEARDAGWRFDVVAHPSRIAPDGAALEIRNLRREPGLAASPHGKL